MAQTAAICEQCSRHPSVLYCLTCARHVCLSCEDSHGGNHSVVATSSALKCAEHRLPFDLYCETCDLLVCATCYQRHAGLQHVICAIQQVFRKKQSIIVSLMTETAFEKKAAIQAQAARLAKRIQDLKGYKTTLEGDVQQLMEQILARLQTWTTPVAQKLEKERESLSRDLASMDGALQTLNSPDRLTFLSSYRSVLSTLETVASRPINPEVEVQFDELPREMQELRTKVQQTVLQKTINQARNDVIWDMLRNCPADAQTSDAAAKREILQWSRLTDKLLQQVADLQFVCYLCKMKVAVESVNTECSMNAMGAVRGELSRDPLVPPSILGNGFHFIVSQHGDVRKQTERFRFVEQPRSKLQIQEKTVGFHPTSKPDPNYASYRQTQEKTSAWQPASRTDFSTKEYGAYTQMRGTAGEFQPENKLEQSYRSCMRETDYGRQTSLKPDGSQWSPAPRPTGFQSGPQTESDFFRSSKYGINIPESTPNTSFRQSSASLSQSLAQKDPTSTAGNGNILTFGGTMRDTQGSGVKIEARSTAGKVGTTESLGRESGVFTRGSDTIGRDSLKFTESFGSSFNPMDSFGAKPTEKPRIDPSITKEVRFSYSDSFKAPSAATPQLVPTKETDRKAAPKPAIPSGNWREKVKIALSAASAMFLNSCKTYDNGAGEVPIDALRISLHKCSHLLSIDDIEAAAKYVGSDKVNYAQFLSAMTQT